jgi:nicotinate-nucleotide adenylyltransferase
MGVSFILWELVLDVNENSSPDQIALFGTSADPPTIGHQKILQWLGQRFDRVAIWAADNPFKTHGTELEHRMEMLKVLVQELVQQLEQPRTNMVVDATLSHTRTIYTVQQARRWWPQSSLTLVVGSDLLSQLPRWYQIESLLAQTRILVIPRPGAEIDRMELEQLRDLGGAVEIGDLIGLPVSSTAYRQDHLSQVLTPQVKAYIRHHHLYP